MGSIVSKLFLDFWIKLVLARFIEASMYRDTFYAIRIAIHFARIAILSVQLLTITVLLTMDHVLRLK